MDNPNKEQVYDEQISPLMHKIIEICQQHGIAVLANFAIPTPANKGLNCTTVLSDETGCPPAKHMIAYEIIKDSAFALAAGLALATVKKSAQSDRPSKLNS